MASGVRVPHQQVEHTAAPTKHRRASKKTLANGEPSTHGDLQPDRAGSWERLLLSGSAVRHNVATRAELAHFGQSPVGALQANVSGNLP